MSLIPARFWLLEKPNLAGGYFILIPRENRKETNREDQEYQCEEKGKKTSPVGTITLLSVTSTFSPTTIYLYCFVNLASSGNRLTRVGWLYPKLQGEY